MSILCTTMLCSYKRPSFLKKAVENLVTTSNPDEHEILVRLSTADPQAEEQAEAISIYSNVKVRIGPQLNGYASLGDYFTELAEYSNGKWIHIFDDDMTLEGRGWFSALADAPDKCMALCEFYKLGNNHYPNGSCDGPGIAWWVPNGCWKELGETAIRMPPDTWMKQLLVDKHGWPIHHLKGTTLNHDWQHNMDGDR